jgi:hypothetical protein
MRGIPVCWMKRVFRNGRADFATARIVCLVWRKRRCFFVVGLFRREKGVGCGEVLVQEVV